MELIDTDKGTPSFLEFNPKLIPYQYQVIYNIKKKFTYENGPHEILLSGSIGSAKSCLLAWLIISHCTTFMGARALIGRRSMPDLKETIFQTIIDMLQGYDQDGIPEFIEDVDYIVNLTTSTITFYVGGRYFSQIISRSWADKKYKKFRSVNISFLAIEEMTENTTKECKGFYTEAIGRLGRIPHIANKECISIIATNPDDPGHFCYDYFIKGSKNNPNRHVVYSLTEMNPFLPKWYIKSLREKYDSKMIQRLLEGKWIYIASEQIYYEYDSNIHYGFDNEIDPNYAVRLTFDFNISKGKPMSSVCFQYNDRTKMFKALDEVCIEGARTKTAIENWRDKGIFDLKGNPQIIIHGDATGFAGDSTSEDNDFEILEKFLSNFTRDDGRSLDFEIQVEEINPSIRNRHNSLNGSLKNDLGDVRIQVNEKCVMLDKGLSKSQLKDGNSYTEDQTTEGQDVAVAFGYGVYAVKEGHYEYKDSITIR